MTEPEFIVIDLFCGAGGTTTGFVESGLAYVVACINHDFKAIKSHWLNHPEVEHFEEDITKLYGFVEHGLFFKSYQFKRLLRLVDLYRAFYPNAKLILWASLECTNFSKAKGGKPKNADSRTLAEHLQFYIYPLMPDMVQIENVVEFMAWGPLDNNGKPVSKKNGRDWLRWRKMICDYGYTDEWRELNSADFGAYTSRNRLFGVFARDRKIIVWPEPTHCKEPSKGKLFAAPNKWKPVKEVLDLDDEGNSIFERKKPLSDKTLERIHAGLVKYVAGGKDVFLAKYYSGKPECKVITADVPAGAITTKDGHSLVKAKFLAQRNSGNPDSRVISVNRPARTLTATGGNQDVVTANFLLKYNSTNKNGKHSAPSVNEPCPVICTQNRLGVINTTFISKYYSEGGRDSSIEEPLGTIPTKDRMATVKAKFLMNTNYNNVGSSIEQSCSTLTASRRHHYLLNPAWGGCNGSIEAPCCTLVARQDKAPISILSIQRGLVAIAIYADDSEVMIRIKEFMVLFEIVDIKMRMLKVPELLKIQGFPDNYVLFGNQSDQKKFIGNSVVPLVVKRWMEAISNNLKLAS
jgi:DNA (cytosine-5)-methyltransferase 1